MGAQGTDDAGRWFDRAEAAREAVVERHVRRLWGIPTSALGVCAYPATRRDRLFVTWNFWWQAHLIDCAVDAHVRTGTEATHELVHRLIRGHWVRNGFRVTNQYYDDMAWLALALERAERLAGFDTRRAQRILAAQFMSAWVPELGGGIPWRKSDVYLNAPANGPAAIFLARTGNRGRAEQMSQWLFGNLLDEKSGLIEDGVDGGPAGRGAVHTEKYTYCQGVAIGLETELSADGDDAHADRVGRLVQAVETGLSENNVVVGAGGGDGGLFAGILVRYLALAATSLDGDGSVDDDARSVARDLVLASAEAAWKGAREVDGHVLFSADWSSDARVPARGGAAARFAGGAVTSSATPERDLSVQLSGWMAMEAAWAVTRGTGSGRA